jgi:Methyltransferase domain
MQCKACLVATEPFRRAIVLGKHDVQYFLCTQCGFVQTEEPFWLDEAYDRAITASDVGLLGRNIYTAKVTIAMIRAFFDGSGRFLDYGGGYGAMVRLMRDAGFDFYRNDPLCENLFAQGFDADLDGGQRYELVTAFEVLEHLVNPFDELTTMARLADHIFVSTNLLPPGPPEPGQWWYYGLEHGQHVCLYTVKALGCIAERLGRRLYTNGVNLHLLTTRRLPSQALRLVTSRTGSTLLRALTRRQSLIPADYHRVSGQHLPGS